jgi:hypothetical protein
LRARREQEREREREGEKSEMWRRAAKAGVEEIT